MSDDVVLSIRDLSVSFGGGGDLRVRAVDGVSLDVRRGRILAVVGESGSGKSVTAMSVLRLISTARADRGAVVLRREAGEIDLLRASDEEMRKVRGREIAMIFQEPMTSLNPVYTIGEQIMEAVLLHQSVSRREARARAIAALERVRIADAAVKVEQYPHEFSGGMRQRVMIAMALACTPRVVLADEPTTALDVTVQAEVLKLLRELCREQAMGVMLITHDLGLVREHADDVAVMYAGRVVERGSVAQVLGAAAHPYTRGLLKCVPRVGGSRERLTTVREEMERGGEVRVGGKLPWWPAEEAGELTWMELEAGHLVGVRE